MNRGEFLPKSKSCDVEKLALLLSSSDGKNIFKTAISFFETMEDKNLDLIFYATKISFFNELFNKQMLSLRDIKNGDTERLDVFLENKYHLMSRYLLSAVDNKLPFVLIDPAIFPIIISKARISLDNSGCEEEEFSLPPYVLHNIALKEGEKKSYPPENNLVSFAETMLVKNLAPNFVKEIEVLYSFDNTGITQIKNVEKSTSWPWVDDLPKGFKYLVADRLVF
ncbi:MAG: hypothetical protein WC415_04700 [Patescibacteria group bacterium]